MSSNPVVIEISKNSNQHQLSAASLKQQSKPVQFREDGNNVAFFRASVGNLKRNSATDLYPSPPNSDYEDLMALVNAVTAAHTPEELQQQQQYIQQQQQQQIAQQLQQDLPPSPMLTPPISGGSMSQPITLPQHPLPMQQHQMQQHLQLHQRQPLASLPGDYQQQHHQKRLIMVAKKSNPPPVAATAPSRLLEAALTAPLPIASAQLQQQQQQQQHQQQLKPSASAPVVCYKCGNELSSRCLMQTCMKVQQQPQQQQPLKRSQSQQQQPSKPLSREIMCKRCGLELSTKCILSVCNKK